MCADSIGISRARAHQPRGLGDDAHRHRRALAALTAGDRAFFVGQLIRPLPTRTLTTETRRHGDAFEMPVLLSSTGI